MSSSSNQGGYNTAWSILKKTKKSIDILPTQYLKQIESPNLIKPVGDPWFRVKT